MNRKFYIVLLAIVLFNSCVTDTDTFTLLPLFPDGMVTTNVSGQVVDDLNQPIEGAMVSMGQLNRLTDENGFFNFKSAQVNSKRMLLNVDKNGFFDGGRGFIPTEENTNLIIQLSEKITVASFDGMDGGQVDLPSGVILNIPTDAVLNQDGIGYSDEVEVAAYSIDPNILDGLQKMPTDFKGVSTTGEEMLLESFGMFKFEWNDANQNNLTIVPGKKVEIQFSVSTALIANAPSTIGLWFYDEVDGMWKEEGTAELQNGFYVAEVGKSGLWNYSQAHEFITVKGVLKNENNQALNYMPYNIELEEGGTIGFAYVDGAGTFIANIPKNISTKIKILDECNDMDYSAEIGALSEDALISNVKINNSSDFSHFVGNLLDCDNNNVQNGYIIISVNTKNYYYPITNGSFSGDMNACDFLTSTMVAYDLDNQRQSEPLQLEIFANVDVGDVSVCL